MDLKEVGDHESSTTKVNHNKKHEVNDKLDMAKIPETASQSDNSTYIINLNEEAVKNFGINFIDIDALDLKTDEPLQIKEDADLNSYNIVNEHIGSNDNNINAKLKMSPKICDTARRIENFNFDLDMFQSLVNIDVANSNTVDLKIVESNQMTGEKRTDFEDISKVQDKVNKNNNSNDETNDELKTSIKICDNTNNLENNVLDLDSFTIQSLVDDNFMDLDISDIETDDSNEPTDLNQTDIESLLKVNKIIKGGKYDDFFIGTEHEINHENNSNDFIKFHGIIPNCSKSIKADGNKNSSNVDLIQVHDNKPNSFEQQNNTVNDLSSTIKEAKDFEDMPMIEVDSDSDCDGYHSSDFELITEEEAKLEGLIIRTRSTLETTKPMKMPEYRPNNTTSQSKTESNIPGPSRINNQHERNDTLKYWSRSYNRRLLIEQYKIDARSHRETHRIPHGDAYLNLFQGYYASTNVFTENKSIITLPCMTLQNVGDFGEREFVQEPVDRKLVKEAEENAKIILERYSRENRRKRRRY